MTVSDLPDLSSHALRVATADLRWRCDPARFAFETTNDVQPISGVVGQDDAVEALRFGLEVHAPGQNVFVRGLTGTGRLSLVERLMRDIEPACPVALDRCYVHDFEAPDRPRLISLPRGRGRALQARMGEFSAYIGEQLVPLLRSDAMRARHAELERALQGQLEEKSRAFDEALAAAGLGLVNIGGGQNARTAIVPVIDGKPAPPDVLAEMRAAGKLDDDAEAALRASISDFAQHYQVLGSELQALQTEHRAALRELYEREARRVLAGRVAEVEASFPFDCVRSFLGQIVEDVVVRRLHSLKEDDDLATRLYTVNLLVSHDDTEGCPVIVENTPTLKNLLGGIDRVVLPNGAVHSDHTMIRAGSLLRAEGGFLVLDARDLLSEPGAWKVLVRTLRTGTLEIVPHDMGILGAGSPIKPEPIDLNVKVVLLGDPGLYYLLDSQDPDFPQLFKVLADFETELPLDDTTLGYYAGVLAQLARDGCLPAFTRDAVAALCEHGARIAGRHDRLTARFGRLADLAREAAFLTTRHDPGQPYVTGEHVREAVRRSRRRADGPSRRFRERIADGTIRIQTHGSEIGQVNGLAVMGAGPLTFGFPARITATVGAGTRGMIDIEQASNLSGRIHTKGFHIIDGLLRHLLRTDHPLAFSASLAFEQSYGGVDGDSASGAQTCCLLSALTGVPLRQDLAMTGAIDQFGHIQPIGGASEKIEGFFDACKDGGLTGTQGAILPRANVRDLMLCDEVVEACAEGRFHVHAVETIHQALELLTGVPAGERDETGRYPEGSLLRRALDRAHDFWRRSTGDFASFDDAPAAEEA